MAAHAHRTGKAPEPSHEKTPAGVPKYMQKPPAQQPNAPATEPQHVSHANAAPAFLPSAAAGESNPLSAWVDVYNDRVAREIGTRAASPEDIPHLVEAALDDGRLITSPTDTRIPPALRDAAPKR